MAALQERVGFKLLARALFKDDYHSLAEQLQQHTSQPSSSTVKQFKNWMGDFIPTDTYRTTLIKMLPTDPALATNAQGILTNAEAYAKRSLPLGMSSTDVENTLTWFNSHLDALIGIPKVSSRELYMHSLEMKTVTAWTINDIAKALTYQAGLDLGIFSSDNIPPRLQTPLYTSYAPHYGVEKFRNIIKALDSYITKYSTYTETLSYRTIWSTENDGLKLSENIARYPFLSTTRNPLKFNTTPSWPVQWIIIGESGVNISSSHVRGIHWPSGDEVLYPSSTDLLTIGENPGNKKKILKMELGLAKKKFTSMDYLGFNNWLRDYYPEANFAVLEKDRFALLKKEIESHYSAQPSGGEFSSQPDGFHRL